MKHQEVIIDGYNLMHKQFRSISADNIAALRDKTEHALQRFQLEHHCAVTIVYDGKYDRNESVSGIRPRVVFTASSSSADQWIVDYVKSLNTRIKKITIVSSDHEVRLYARAFGANCLTSEAFIAMLDLTRRAKNSSPGYQQLEGYEKNRGKFSDEYLSKHEVDEWKRLFNTGKT
ncbi:NYN domain-containing protein [Chlorobium phaeobacteroides]|uniref:NYN domain-containing protein n=1 Tax=Chlorobium phaeobacteroides (strain DSM 266 / SMG 266 / 2430) TaxID=290317 RepID=A1BJY8_CHLPD|nr:NYN domain-containing protein [Chlorobium phaeobacteroides]ABL66715.1 conserved hypothetical protein [Chlorobium phaeobacteroides DSM 266]